MKSFELYKRAFHVYSEAKRVYDFKHVCDKADGSGENQAGMDINRSLFNVLYLHFSTRLFLRVFKTYYILLCKEDFNFCSRLLTCL